ncbi:hypothetical protein IAT38_001573 [Cryptococcus sp. DSM 104549]
MPPARYNPAQGRIDPPGSNIVRPSPTTPYHPPSDTATYRDLLLFEERLKSNAEMLKRRRQRYSIFLWSFVAILITMGHMLLFQPPENLLRMRALQASVAVVLITLVLFFASGMYEEKIRYAHSYINHSNKALRPLNMHLNMRRPRASILAYIPFLPSSLRHSTSTAANPSATPSNSAKPSPFGLSKPSTAPSGPKGRRVSATPNVMATIPPSSNPRGELIFSSRVDRAFREGYERYRAAFERRREEKAREEARRYAAATGWFWSKQRGRKGSPSPSLSVGGSASGSLGGDASSVRGVMGPTPPVSRRETPPPSLGAASGVGVGLGVGGDTQSRKRRSASPSSLSKLMDESTRTRSESYSFVLESTGTGGRRGS